MSSQGTNLSFQPLRAAVIAAGVVVFLFAFRPFGMVIDSVGAAVVLLSIAPLNFLIMLGIHALPLRREPWRGIVAIVALVLVNTTYLAVWSGRTPAIDTTFAVVLVVGLTAIFVVLWNRGRIPEQEFKEGQVRTVVVGRPITLSGEGQQEILQLTADELLYMTANGNYVDVHYRKGDKLAKSMLRSSLAGLVAQVPENLLIQCHRSHFVNLAAARRIIRAKGRTLIEFDESERVPVSRKFRHEVVNATSA